MKEVTIYRVVRVNNRDYFDDFVEVCSDYTTSKDELARMLAKEVKKAAQTPEHYATIEEKVLKIEN